MSNQAEPDNIELYAENDFEFQISLERAFAQLEGDDSNVSLLNCLETLTLISQNKSIKAIAAQLETDDDETKVYLSECRQRLMQYPPIQWCWENYSEPNNFLLFNGTAMMSNKEEQNWINLLAGQTVPKAVPNMVRETQLFRAALLSHSDKPQNAEEIPYPDILDNVLARLEAEKLLHPPKPSWFEKWRSKFSQPHTSSARQWYYKPQFAFAVLVLVVAFIIIPPQLPRHEPMTQEEPSETIEEPDGFEDSSRSKGTEPCVNDLYEAQQPQAIASQLQQELKTFGITAIVSQSEEVWRLETTVPADKLPALDHWLKRYDFIVLPESHYLCIDISSKKDMSSEEYE